MKHWTFLILVVLAGVSAVFWAEHKKVNTQASPDALVYFIGDSQRELTRLPIAMTKMSDEEEIRIGDEMAARYSRWRRPGQESPEDRQVREYVEQVGSRVAAKAHRKLPYKFHYIPEPYFVNAFALPGGHVFIGQGLINLMDSEDELANVLGHEVEHIDLNHCVERVQIEARMRRLKLGVIGEIANIPIQIFEAGYSKEQELAADREGTRLAVAAKYSPEGAVRMFETFEKFEPGHANKPGSPQEEIATVALSSLVEYFRTHPPSKLRAQEIQKLIAEEKWPAVKETDLQVAYLKYNALAQNAYSARKYKEAMQYAKRSLELHPRQSELVRLTAQSEFMLGDFAGSAESYRRLLTEFSSWQPEDEHSYADALAATRSSDGKAEFDKFAAAYEAHSDTMAMGIRVDRAGLHLIAGDPKLAEGLDQELGALNKDYTAEMLARLAWWYYRAGNPQKSAALLEQATELSPQDSPRYRAARAWPEIEQKHYDSALSFYGGDAVGMEANAIRAVGMWLANNHEGALREYEGLANDPSWSNRNWVKGNYSATVVSAIDQMQQERDRRLAARKR